MPQLELVLFNLVGVAWYVVTYDWEQSVGE